MIHGVVLLPALQAFLLQDSFLQPLHLNGRLKKKERNKEKKRKKSVASRPKTRGAAQHHIQATSAPPQSSILALQQSTVPVSVTTSKVLTIAPPAVVGIISPHQRWWASSQRSARRVEIEKCSQTHMSLVVGPMSKEWSTHLLIFTGKRMMRIITQRNKSCVGSEKHMLRLVTCARAAHKGCHVHGPMRH